MARPFDLGPALQRGDPRAPLRRSARSLAIGQEVRGVVPETPRAPSRADLEFLARSLVRDAVRAEFVREGLDAVDLPADFRRTDLQAAALLTDRDYLAFVDRTVALIQLRDPAPDAREARRVATAGTSRDRYGLTIEAATALASYIVAAAHRLDAPAAAGDDRHAPGAEPTADEAAPLRDAARETLASLVTAPEELRAAMALRDAGGANANGTPGPAADVPSSGAAGTRMPPLDGAQQTRPSSADAGGRPGSSRGGRDERWRASDVRRLLDHADTARAFFESDTGRAAADLFRRGSSAMRDRAAQRRGGTGPQE